MRIKSPWLTGLLLVIASVAITQLAALLVNEWSEDVEIRGYWRVILTLIAVIASIILALYLRRFGNQASESKTLFADKVSSNCGNQPLDLSRERLFLSSALGTYFASLLEAPDAYEIIEGQIECYTPEGLAGLDSFQRILYELIDRNGAQILVIASDGGMGKSTLSAKIVRCLYGQREYSRILGDSAKDKVVEIQTGKIKEIEPGFLDHVSFLAKLAAQLGIEADESTDFNSTNFIRSYLAGQDVLIVVDNLETVNAGDELMKIIKELTGRSIRAIITTRESDGFERDRQTFVVHLKAFHDPQAVVKFVEWHINSFAPVNPELLNLQRPSRSEANLLIDKSGGVPLVIQLLLSDVARSKGWRYLESLSDPGLPEETLDYFFSQRWAQLQDYGPVGTLAIQLLSFVGTRQMGQERTSYDDLSSMFVGEDIGSALDLLHNRFLILNQDMKKGDFTILPHLLQFMSKHQLIQ